LAAAARPAPARDVSRFLAGLDAEPSIGARTVNKYRQILCSVFEHAMREDTCRRSVDPRVRQHIGERRASTDTIERADKPGTVASRPQR
jgi:hypothetical protein